MNKRLYILLSFALVVLIASCEKNITVKQLPYQSKLSIQCLITPGQKPMLYFNRTVPYFDAKVNTRELTLDNATVKLNDGNADFILLFDSLYNYHFCRYDYFYKGSQVIQSNKTYTLTINYSSNIYTAQATTNQVSVPITSTSYVQVFKDIYGEHEGVIVGYTDKPGTENYYRYQMGRMIDSSVKSVGGVKSGCTFGAKYYVQEIGRTIYPNKNVDGLALTFTFEPTYSHKKNDSGYISLQSVDKNIFAFYDNLDRQKLAQFNPFVEPVFIIPGQFTNAIGVFGAYTVSDSVLFVYPE